MENIFSPKRFGNLLNKHFREHLRTYLMSLVVFGTIIFVFFMFIAFTSKGRPLDIGVQVLILVYSFFLGSFIFTGSIFSNYNHSRSAFPSTMLPASIFEKYLLYWLVSLIGFTILALGVYHLSQNIIIEYLKTQGIHSAPFYVWKPGNDTFPVKLLISIYLLSHSIAFFGAISFRKKTVIITALLSFITLAVYTYLNYRLSLIALNGVIGYKLGNLAFPFFSAQVLTTEGWAFVNQPNNELWTTTSLSALFLLLWICAYFKLKERQV